MAVLVRLFILCAIARSQTFQDYQKALDISQEKVIATCLAHQCVGGEKYNVLMDMIAKMNATNIMAIQGMKLMYGQVIQ